MSTRRARAPPVVHSCDRVAATHTAVAGARILPPPLGAPAPPAPLPLLRWSLPSPRGGSAGWGGRGLSAAPPPPGLFPTTALPMVMGCGPAMAAMAPLTAVGSVRTDGVSALFSFANIPARRQRQLVCPFRCTGGHWRSLCHYPLRRAACYNLLGVQPCSGDSPPDGGAWQAGVLGAVVLVATNSRWREFLVCRWPHCTYEPVYASAIEPRRRRRGLSRSSGMLLPHPPPLQPQHGQPEGSQPCR